MSSISPAESHEILNQRTFAFSAPEVFAAWADPVRLARWWGPAGFTNTFEQFDFRPGGEWRFVMHGPDGRNCPNYIRFIDIVPNEQIVLEHLGAPHFILTASLLPRGGQTHMAFRQSFDSAEMRDKIAVFAVDANEQNLDRLEAELQRVA